MTRGQIRALAMRAVMTDVNDMAAEIAGVFKEFKELRPQIRASLQFARGAGPRLNVTPRKVARKKKRKMSEAQKKAIGARMKLFWAKRRADKAAAAKATGTRQARSGKRQGS